MFQMDPTMILIKTLQADRERKYPRRHWNDVRTTRASRKSARG
jgi:hypothetical protein